MIRMLPAAAAALMLAAPATADAARYSFQQATFNATIVATQVTTWKHQPTASAADCSPVIRVTGGGRETIRLKSRRPLRVKAFRVYGRSTLTVDSTSLTAREVPAKIERTASERIEEVAGTCAGNEGRVTQGGPYDCGRRDRMLDAHLGYTRGRLSLKTDEALLAPLTSPRYETCPLPLAAGVQGNNLTEISQRLPARDLFDRRIGKHIVLARRTFRGRVGDVATRTTVRWTITLRRTGRR